MKEIKVYRVLRCDVCGENHLRVAYNTPTKLGPWGTLCEGCMEEVGIMTSVTEKLVT